MATGEQADDIGELRGQVRGLQSGFNDLGRKLDEGLKGLTDYIRSSTERTEARIDAQGSRTDLKFEELAKAQLDQVAGKSSNYATNLGIAVTAILGVAGLGGTFWALTKAPIDSNFSRLDNNVAIISNKLDATFASIGANYVPKEQINTQFKFQGEMIEKIADRQFTVALNQARGLAEIEAMKERLIEYKADLKTAVLQGVSKDQLAELAKRLDTTEGKLQYLYDKNYATSKFPCLDSGAGCGPVGNPGPSAQPSVGATSK